MCGITLAAANFVKLIIFDHVAVTVAVVICLALVCAVMIAKKLGFDPAAMASPFITTIVDTLSLLVYFSIATHLLNL